MLSGGKLYSTLGHWGVGVFANKTLKTGEVVMEAYPNQTISSFDSVFPYQELVDNITIPLLLANVTDFQLVAELRLLLNLNYLRYFQIENRSRFFKFFFETLPDYYDYLPYWKEEEKAMIAKFTFHQDLRDTLFKHESGDMLDILIELIVKKLKNIDPSFIQLALNDVSIKQAVNIIKTRTQRISLKGWKILHGKIDEVQEDGIFQN